MITRLGGGSYSDVYKAKEKSTGELVAIKVLKKRYKKWEECLELRECKSLQKLHNDSLSKQLGNENIIKMKQIIFIKKTGILNLVFEFMETDLLELMNSKEPKKLSEEEIRDIMYQTLLGLSFMHKYGFFHRDMKPENLLLIGKKIKIADFGLAREVRSIPPYTEYVSTRYYRAPECILKFTNYNSPIDIWGLGCIMAEMYLHPQPLFFGSNEKEVLFRICSILGSPNYDNWPDGIQQANLIGIKFPNNDPVNLSNIIPNASNEAIDLIKQMLQWDPNKRPTAATLLNHPFFTNHTIYEHFFTNINITCSDFDETSFKKFSNKNQGGKSGLNTNEIKSNDKNDNSKMMTDNDIEKLITQMKKEKIEEDKKYEKEKDDIDNYNDEEDEFDLGNIVNDNMAFLKTNDSKTETYNNNKDDKTKVEESPTTKNFMNKDINQKNNINDEDSDDEFDLGIKSNVELKPKTQVFNNNRRSARKFLEETENSFQGNKNPEAEEKSNINYLLFQSYNKEYNNFSDNKPVIMSKNELFVSRRGDNNHLNRLFEGEQSNNMMIGDNEFPIKNSYTFKPKMKNDEKFDFSLVFKNDNNQDKKDSFFGNNSRRNHNK